ncbi:MAG: nickel pincer cofactor biosynthesis protein LarB [Synechococcales bacterium]|nr:nickel pincer cofactor biosynthesis protein LarB [Synechococcales bacterium]
MTQPETLRSLLQAVATGQLHPDAAFSQLKDLAYESVGTFAHVDHHRALRTGFPEVIWGPGKTPEQIAAIMNSMRDRSAVVMATRIEPEVYEWIRQMLPEVEYFAQARICALRSGAGWGEKRVGAIALLSAGTADLPVAEEAAVTAELAGFTVKRLWDVGVAGIHRLLSNVQVLADADVIIVVAGMEGALPSVVGGLVDCPVIAVPTSVGYGASFNGLAALLGMLNSCSAGIGVVNIDNGFGAARLACQILRSAAKYHRG